jgi:hypothetical protein
VVLEVAFAEEWRWERCYGLPAVQAALDATRDPVKGLLVHRGRGGSSGTRLPRRPRPLAGAGAVELPEPDPDPFEEDPLAPSWIGPRVYDDGRHPSLIRRRWTNPLPALLVGPCPSQSLGHWPANVPGSCRRAPTRQRSGVMVGPEWIWVVVVIAVLVAVVVAALRVVRRR